MSVADGLSTPIPKAFNTAGTKRSKRRGGRNLQTIYIVRDSRARVWILVFGAPITTVLFAVYFRWQHSGFSLGRVCLDVGQEFVLR